MNSNESLKEMENFFLALADGTRLRLLNLMRENEICVYFFTEILGESQPKISRHLAYLRSAGLVSARRDGKWMHYKIVLPEDAAAARILRSTLDAIKSSPAMQADFAKLLTAGDAAPSPTTISPAPKPDVSVETNMIYKRKEVLEIFLL